MARGGVAMNDSAKMMYPWWGGRTVFTASGLSTEGGSGDAWGFDAEGAWSEEAAAAAAAATRHVRVPARFSPSTLAIGPGSVITR